jgi:hypothetical protein
MTFLGVRFESVRLELARSAARTAFFAGMGAFFLFVRSSETDTGTRVLMVCMTGLAAFLIVLLGFGSIQEIRRIRRKS